jgi:protein-tyrosine phosphatase
MQLEVTGKDDRWMGRHFGSRRGFVRACWHRFLYLFGKYRQYRQVDWQSIERLVFVCKGNICRSAYAEAVAHSLGIDAVSCGLDTIENAPANRDAILTAMGLGFDLQEHKTTPIMYMVLRKTDLLVVMEPWQGEFLEMHLTRKHHKTLLGIWAKPVLPHIQDPYGSSSAYFNKSFGFIKDSVHELAKKIQKKQAK